MSDTILALSRSSRPRVAAVLGLTLLEVIRRQDRPSEVLEAEDTSITMPRRLGLSDVIERQIRTYREEVRRGRRMSDDQVHDLVRLVIRRPDSEEVFFRAGRVLAPGPDGAGSRAQAGGRSRNGPAGWRRLLPGPVAFALARRSAGRRLSGLFGRRYGGFGGGGPYVLEARAHLLLEADPGGDACAFVTGLSEAMVQSWVGPEWRVAHTQCQGRKDPLCRWTVLAEERVADAEGVRDLLLNPEPS